MAPIAASYRIQFRSGMTFDRAARQLPYLQNLGISHIYASPIFTATQGSTHGYDVTNVTEIDPSLGGRAAFNDFSRRLQDLGMGLILDIVPNHMAASLENPWWHSVLNEGKDSRYASFFDIDWSEPITLPHLDLPFDDAAADGKIKLVRDDTGLLALQYGEQRYPLCEESRAWLQELGHVIDDDLSAFASVVENLRALHDRQHWRLVPWTSASSHLSYRRFFEVTGLVGIRVEDPMFFDAMHALVFELVRDGQVDALRIDHIDGLADPNAYLENLRRAVGADVPVFVEKILSAGESLPATWPVAGTTGYEFISALSDLFISRKGLAQLSQQYSALVPSMADPKSGLRQAKYEMVTVNFAGEVNRLVQIMAGLLPSVELPSLADAIRELLIAFPVYRLYSTTKVLTAEENKVLDRAAGLARKHVDDRTALDAVVNILRGQAPTARDPAEFRCRFQQLAGPIMAKATEDTFFYRYNCLLAANEVGSEPAAEPSGIAGFHLQMQRRLRQQPLGISSTSTHDTKRGEDARARLYALSEGADAWMTALPRWRLSNSRLVSHRSDGMVPDLNVEWMLYQTLLGIIPSDVNVADLPGLQDRFCAYAVKALREAKLNTNWTAPDSSYEDAVQRFARGLVSIDNLDFLTEFADFSRPFVASGKLNSLVQTLVKLTAPGVPDFYQGAEGLDFSMVDPDNRRPWKQDEPVAKNAEFVVQSKLEIIKRGLSLRQRNHLLFEQGAYVPLTVEGARKDQVLAFARQAGGELVVVVAPLRLFGVIGETSLTADPSFWEDTIVRIPATANSILRDVISDKTHVCGDVFVADILTAPVALLTSTT
ncbi:malto-oligosyltrehalose synthase [Rhizobium sp. PDO1-076]|uniref:malto-oligosyltrehalose synthase n=1 Tax=Rhizobium sp. PDO1-076 TaxID=1125979 RepID=UPI00024E33A4|nr:malto-oligosyltrehalose synthase [Rhizobium sp. PDO1-076]EHS54059.1 malto-oligosyltrehalose synthase [Rhizobium sp. PDO1-076]